MKNLPNGPRADQWSNYNLLKRKVDVYRNNEFIIKFSRNGSVTYSSVTSRCS